MSTHPKFFTFIDNAPITTEAANDIPVHDQPYQRPEDVPIPVRDMIRRAHESGLKTSHLVQIYEMPKEWIELFAKPTEGNA